MAIAHANLILCAAAPLVRLLRRFHLYAARRLRGRSLLWQAWNDDTRLQIFRDVRFPIANLQARTYVRQRPQTCAICTPLCQGVHFHVQKLCSFFCCQQAFHSQCSFDHPIRSDSTRADLASWLRPTSHVELNLDFGRSETGGANTPKRALAQACIPAVPIRSTIFPPSFGTHSSFAFEPHRMTRS